MRKEKQGKSQIARIDLTHIRSEWILISLMIAFAAVAVAVFRPWPLSAASKVDAGPPTEAAEAAAFGPTIPSTAPVPAPSPPGMGWIPGGEFAMGAMDPPSVDEVGMQAAPDARPVHRVYANCL
jgi:formylglycine-generating enzyme